MYKIIVAVLLLAAVASSQLVGWRNCGSPLAIVHRLRISGCSHTPCSAAVGETLVIEVDATSQSNTVNMPFAVTVTFLGIPITLLEGNACPFLTYGSCPVVIGNNFSARLEYTVPAIIPPGIQAVVTASVWNDYGDIGICVQIDAYIVARPTNEISD